MPASRTTKEAGIRPEDDPLEHILELVRVRHGVDFSQYRRPTIRRRVEARMRAVGNPPAAAYLERLLDEPAEAERLAEYLTIKVTGFFRDGRVWERLSRVAAEELRPVRDERPVRVWSAGCSTGEEAYGLAMLLAESGVPPDPDGPDVQATDVDPRALARARRGVFTRDRLEPLPAELRERHFGPTQERERPFGPVRGAARRCVVQEPLRRRVDFRLHDLAAARTSPLALSFDLVLCRNVLIYLDPAARGHALGLLVSSLRPGGLLCLGDAEWIGGSAGDALVVVDQAARLFRRPRPVSE